MKSSAHLWLSADWQRRPRLGDLRRRNLSDLFQRERHQGRHGDGGIGSSGSAADVILSKGPIIS